MPHKTSLKYLTFPGVVIFLIVVGVFLIGMKGSVSKEDPYQQFADRCLEGHSFQNSSQIFDQLRHCLYQNSVHRIDEKYFATLRQGREAFVEAVMDHFESRSDDRPHMECSSRSIFLNEAYKSLGYESQTITIVQRGGKFLDHVVVQVFNPATQKYEVHDPSYDVYYNAVESEARLDIVSLLKRTADQVTPCAFGGECSWDMRTPDNKRSVGHVKDYWTLAYLNIYGKKKGPLLYNPQKLLPYEIFYNKGLLISYCSKRPAHCAVTVNIMTTNVAY